MPIYEYRCRNGHTFEVMQGMTEDPLAVCQTCEAPVQRVFHPVAVHFKGSGFYTTDYGSKRPKQEAEKPGGEGGDKTESKSQDKKDKSSKEGSGRGSSDS
jgi:putative FmdB family regulatory protein